MLWSLVEAVYMNGMETAVKYKRTSFNLIESMEDIWVTEIW